MSRKTWTTKEEALLASLWGVVDYREIAERLERSCDSVLTRASRLGLKSLRTIHSRHSVAELRELIDFGYNATQIAMILGSSTKSIMNTVRDRIGGQVYRKLKTNTWQQREINGVLTPVYRKSHTHTTERGTGALSHRCRQS